MLKKILITLFSLIVLLSTILAFIIYYNSYLIKEYVKSIKEIEIQELDIHNDPKLMLKKNIFITNEKDIEELFTAINFISKSPVIPGGHDYGIVITNRNGLEWEMGINLTHYNINIGSFPNDLNVIGFKNWLNISGEFKSKLLALIKTYQ